MNALQLQLFEKDLKDELTQTKLWMVRLQRKVYKLDRNLQALSALKNTIPRKPEVIQLELWK